MPTLTLLGTGTCLIEHNRRASSVLLDLDDTYILFDCGHGIVQRLLEVGVRHHQLQYIVLSHFHPDHVSDIIPLLHAGAWSQRDPRTTDIHIYGPLGLQKIIDGLLQVFGPQAFQQPTYKIVVHEVTRQHFEIGAHHFDFISLPPAGNHGLRFEWNDKRYAFTGDSHFHDAEIEFLRGVDLAIIDSGHLADTEIVQLAVSSQAKTIVCSHLYREINAQHLQSQAASEGYRGDILVGRDLMSFIV